MRISEPSFTDCGIDATAKTEDQTWIRVDGRSAPSTLSLPMSRRKLIWGCGLRGAFCDPLAGGCRTPNPNPWGSLRGACPLMHAPPRAVPSAASMWRAETEKPAFLGVSIFRLTTTSPMGIRYPIPIRRGGLEGFHPSISAEPSGQGRGAATDDAQQSRPLGGLRRSPAGHVLSAAKV